MILAIGLSFLAWLVKGRRRAGARACAPRLARFVRRWRGNLAGRGGIRCGYIARSRRLSQRSRERTRTPGDGKGTRPQVRREGALFSYLIRNSGNVKRPIGLALAQLDVRLPGLGRLTVWAGDRRRHRRQEQIAAPAGIGSAVHWTAGC